VKPVPPAPHKINLQTADWHSWETTAVEGDAMGQNAWLAQQGSHGNAMACGLFIAEPSVFRSTIKEDETIFVIEGNVVATFEGGELDLHAGDAAWFPKGTGVTWHVKERFKELWVYSS
jgi:uncharacterized cupin superfamily protein